MALAPTSSSGTLAAYELASFLRLFKDKLGNIDKAPSFRGRGGFALLVSSYFTASQVKVSLAPSAFASEESEVKYC